MKRKHRTIFVAVIIVTILFFTGPRLDTHFEFRPVHIPEDVQQYIETAENKFSDIRHGTAKQVIWANPESKKPTPYSIVYLHGFSASRQEIAPVCEQLAIEFSANLFYTRLTGHGRTSQAMKDVTVNTLLNDAIEALEIGKRIGEKVILIGSSTGGTLATWLSSQQQSGNLSAVILLSPNFGLKRMDSELLFYPWGQSIMRLIQGEEYQFAPVNTSQEKYWTTRYPTDALLAMFGLIDVVRHSSTNAIKTPTLILYSEDDKILDVEKIKLHYDNLLLDAKKLVAITDTQDPQHHILAGNILSPATTEKVVTVIREFLVSQFEDLPRLALLVDNSHTVNY